MMSVRSKSQARSSRQKGYMLLALMLLVTMMLLALSVVLPRVTQQMKREKEDELVHRGKEYAMAIKRYYHSPASRGNYPTSLEQLESANHMRFLRKRFKDPMTIDGEWRLIHFGEAEIKLTNPAGGPASSPGASGSLNTSPLGGSATPSPAPSASPSLFASPSPGTLGAGPAPGAGGQLGSLNITTSPGQAGGGFIIGVASKSKETSIKEFNGNNEYDEWLFVFDPRLECQQPAGTSAIPSPCSGNGITIASPRSPNAPPINPPPGQAPSVSPTPVSPGGVPSPTPPPQNPL
jgi:type II secretory pathway pseudopilin PulG